MPHVPNPNKKNILLNDQSEMTFGKQFKGKKLLEVPSSYLLWVWDNTDVKEKFLLGQYIYDNMEGLKADASLTDKDKNK